MIPGKGNYLAGNLIADMTETAWVRFVRRVPRNRAGWSSWIGAGDRYSPADASLSLRSDLGCPAGGGHSGPRGWRPGVVRLKKRRENDVGPVTVMTKALKDAFREAQELPEGEQDQLAAAIRAEIEAERAWEAQLAASGDTLAALADEALAEHRSGRTLPLDPDEK